MARAGFVSLAVPSFRLALAAILIQHLGVWMRIVALGWLVVERTGSPMKLGWTYFWTYLPFLVVAPPAGALGDRFDRKLLLLSSTAFLAATAALTGLVAAQPAGGMWPIYALTFAIGCALAIAFPIVQAAVPSLVPRDMLPSAIAVNSIAFNITRVIGPALAGLTVAHLGVAACFYLYALTSVAFIVIWLWIPLPRAQVAPAEGAHGQTGSSAVARLPLLDNLRRGFAHARRHAVLRVLLPSVTVLSIFSQQFQYLLPAFAKQVLYLDADGFGVLGAAVGVGGMLGTVGVSLLATQRARSRALVVSFVAIGAAMICFAWVRGAWLAWVAAAAFGGTLFAAYSLSNILVQLAAPEEMRARILSLYTVGAMGVYPIGALISGFVSSWLGMPWTLTIAGAVLATYGVFLIGSRRTLEI